jgi:flagellin-like protein
MDDIQDSAISGVISLVVAVVFTVAVAQLIEPPWDLVGALIAVGIAAFFSGFFGRYYADRSGPTA